MPPNHRPLPAVLHGGSLVAGPCLLAASTFFWNAEGRLGVTGGTLTALALVFWLYGLIGLYAEIQRRLPVYGAIALLLTVYGALGGMSFGFQGFFEASFQVPKDASLAAVNAYPLPADLLLWWAGPAFPVALLALGAALLRTGLAPRWTAVLICLGAVAFPASRIPRLEWVAHVCDAALALPFVYLGAVELLRLRPGMSNAALGHPGPGAG